MLMLFDTLQGAKRPFLPLLGRTVRIYTCGPSVYNYSHIGNFRTYLFEDILVRYLRHKGYRVKRVMNITDFEDKAIDAARREGKSLRELETEKVSAFFEDWKLLGMEMPDIVAKSSGHVPQMIRLIRKICARGYCIDGGDGIYYDVRRFGRYGELGKLAKREYMGTARNDDYAKQGLWDFRLWKRWTKGDGNVSWDSPFGKGRPGWHIECSAMSMHYLGERFDIHCGGSDNIFPHHENEIAQGMAATGKNPANFWLHARHLTIGKRKMSKRTGNVLYVKQLERKGIPPKCLRFYLISERYRRPLDFTIRRFGEEICVCDRARGIIRKLERIRTGSLEHGMERGLGKQIAGKLLAGFEHAMDNDLNTSLAFARIFKDLDNIEVMMKEGRISKTDAKEILNAVTKIDSVFGVF